jgi:trimeric autotransporter adhesin
MRFASTICFLAVLFLAFFTAPQALASNSDSPSLCCPSDLDGDGVVGSSDLADMLSAWGPASAGDAADLDASGEIDAIDIAILIGSWGGCPAPCLKTLVIGSVQLADGTPVADAVIVTELGGQGVSDAAGAFSFEVELLSATESLTVTAIASLEGTTFTGTKLVSPITLDGVTDAGVISITASTGCAGEFGWLPGFGLPGLNGPVLAMTVFDDGSGRGPALYVGGDFTEAGGVSAMGIARWDGSEWSTCGTGVSGGPDPRVIALIVHDDGDGPALIAAGSFLAIDGVPANSIARWNGASWSPLGVGTTNGVNDTVLALTSFDDGGGSKLYAGGTFTQAGGLPAGHVARWNGRAWEPLGDGATNGTNEPVYALLAFDDGAGAALYAGGEFTEAGGNPALRIARWKGTRWSPIGDITGAEFVTWVSVLAAFDDGSGGGPALVAGGSFTAAGGVPAQSIARWDGGSWSALGSAAANGVNGQVYALTAFDDGRGPALYVGGEFVIAGGVSTGRLARWDGQAWSPVLSGSSMAWPGAVGTIAVFDDGTGPSLHVGGAFLTATNGPGNNFAKLDGSSVAAPFAAGPLGRGVDNRMMAATVFDDGSGPALFAGGSFTQAGGVRVNGIAKWDGSAWSALGSGAAIGVNGQVRALAVFDDGKGSGPALYAGGFFTTAGGVPASCIAKWDGESWAAVGSGASQGVNSTILTLAAVDHEDGQGARLYAGGVFTTAGGLAANRVAAWNGSVWSSLGVGPANGVNDHARAMAMFDDGTGPALYVGGDFTVAGGAAMHRIARWNGQAWSSLGSGGTNGLNFPVYALTVFGEVETKESALIVGGQFWMAGGQPASRIARWDGTAWSSLGAGIGGTGFPSVYALTVFDDGTGSGPQLYAGGLFTTAGGAPANRIARWDGASWAPLGSGVSITATSEINALASFASPTQNGTGAPRSTLYAGGLFTGAGGIPSHNIAAWGCTASRGD